MMINVARPVLDFLSSMYPSELQEQNTEREIANRLTSANLGSIATSKGRTLFTVRRQGAAATKETVEVQFSVMKDDLEKAKRHLKKPSWSARRVVQHIFESFMKTEIGE